MMRWLTGIVIVAALAIGGLTWGWQYLTAAQWPQPPELGGEVIEASLQHEGVWRTFRYYVPASVVSRPPAIFGLHSGGGDGTRFRTVSSYEFDRLADRHGFIMIYPDGFENHWNDCRRQGSYSANAQNIDDVGFLLRILDDLENFHGIDRQAVFATGLSNGAQMAFRMALEAPDHVTAIAAIAASLPTDDNLECRKSNVPVPAMILNGTEDPINHSDGGVFSFHGLGRGGEVMSAPATARYFADLAGISAPVQPDLHYVDSRRDDNSLAQQRVWQTDRKPQVVLLTLAGAGHTIPHPETRFPRVCGRTNQDLNGPRLIWQFFETILGTGEGGFGYDSETLDQLPIEP